MGDFSIPRRLTNLDLNLGHVDLLALPPLDLTDICALKEQREYFGVVSLPTLGSGAVLEGVEEVLGTQVPGVPAGGEVAIRIWRIWLDSRLGCPTPAAARQRCHWRPQH